MNINNINNQLYPWLLLALTPGVGPATMLKLVHHFGTIDNVLKQDSAILGQFINKTIARLIVEQKAKPEVEQALLWQTTKPNRQIIHFNHPLYPESLTQIASPPLVLFLEGNIELLNSNKLAVVGTRHPTPQGKENAFNFSRDLANNNLTIVSGMAAGIDRYAHLGALDGKNSTIGIVGTGIDLIYPKSNHDLFTKVKQNGLLISEFPLKTAPLAQNFPRRNRIITGLSLGCLVVEASLDSGSLITADFALEMGREVMAIPGSIHSSVSKGCHKLIKNGAKLIENTNDIFEELNLNYQTSKANNIQQSNHPILNKMGFEPIEIDALCLHTKLSFADICAELLHLELAGLIQNCGNGRYQRIIK